jgi:hypothetical protein
VGAPFVKGVKIMCKTNDKSGRRLRKVLVKAIGETVMRYAEKRCACEESQDRETEICQGGVCKIDGDFRLHLKALKETVAAVSTTRPTDSASSTC